MTKEILIKVSTPEGVECTDKEFKDWVLYELGCVGGISISNPLSDYELEADEVYIRPTNLNQQ